MNEPRGDLRLHRPHREEAVRDRTEGGADEMAVGEAWEDDRSDPRPGLLGRDEALDRGPERRVERRAGAADALDPLDLVIVLAQALADCPLGLFLSLSRQKSTITHDFADRGNDVYPLGEIGR